MCCSKYWADVVPGDHSQFQPDRHRAQNQSTGTRGDSGSAGPTCKMARIHNYLYKFLEDVFVVELNSQHKVIGFLVELYSESSSRLEHVLPNFRGEFGISTMALCTQHEVKRQNGHSIGEFLGISYQNFRR